MTNETASGSTSAGTGADPDGVTFEENRHDQLTSAPNAVEADAAPRIAVSSTPGHPVRIDWREDADVRPGPGDDEPAV